MAEKKEKTDRFEDVISSGVDFKNRRIYFGSLDDNESDVDWSTTERVIRALHRMSDLPSREPITLYVNSFGGDVYDALSIVDEIESLTIEVHFVGGGKIMSSATIIMSACDYRMLHKNATVMVHEVSDSSMPDGVVDARIELKHTNKLMDTMLNLYANNSNMPIGFWQDVCQRNTYLTAKEAVAIGFADQIIDPLDRSEFRTKREEQQDEVDQKEVQKVVGSIYSRIGHRNTPKLVFGKD